MSVLLMLIVWFIFSAGQGFVIGYVLNVISFRSQSLFNQFNLAMILFVGVMPCLYRLTAWVGGINAAVLLSLSMLVASLLIAIWRRRRFTSKGKHLFRELLANRVFLLICLIWILLSLTMLVDVQVGDKLYPSVSMYDHSNKVAMADEIARTGIPIKNPYFYPGRLVGVYYHYYWPMLCTIISTLSGFAYDTRATVLSGVIWTGTVFLCFLRLCAAYFRTLYVPKRQLVVWALILLVVSNLYGLVMLPLNLLRWFTLHQLFGSFGGFTADKTWPFVQAMLWVPHNMAGLIAGMFGSLMLIKASEQERTQHKICQIVLAGACLSSNCGLSAHLAIGFALSWAVWAVLSLCQRRIHAFAVTAAACCASLFLTIPYLNELAVGQGNCAQLTFGVRHFEVIDFLFPDLKNMWALQQLAYLLCLPVNYLVGFGFILVAAILYWTDKNARQGQWEAKQSFLIVMALVSIVLASFVRSQYNNNDFGYRIIMLAHLAILLWAAYYLASQQQQKALKLSSFLKSLIAIGLFSFFYALYNDRTAPFFVYRGERIYAIRSLYEVLNRKLPLNAVVQHNPVSSFFGLDVFAQLYSHRQVVSSEKIPCVPNVPDKEEYERVTSELLRLFDKISPSDAIDICHRWKITVLLVKDTDKIWSYKSSWVSRFPIIAQNRYARAYLVNTYHGRAP